jgi:rhodanese-related sulfurtransferase
MSTSQILIYSVLTLIIVFYLRRWWMTRSIIRYSAQQVTERLKQGGAVLLDVRTNAERSNSHIKGSLHIPLQELGRRTDNLQKHREKEIICYCQTGSRSLVAAARLMKQGFKVADMTGGISEWNFAQLR